MGSKIRTSTKTAIIKKVFGEALANEGFRYKKYKKKGYKHWAFERPDGEWVQYIYIIEHDTQQEVWVEIEELKPEEDAFQGSGYPISYFVKELSFTDVQIPYVAEYKFEKAMEQLKEWTFQYLLPNFGRLRRPRYRYCVTEEMQREVYQHHEELAARLIQKYGGGEMREEHLVCFVEDIVKEYADSSMEEFKETFLELSAYLGECFVRNIAGARWIWKENYKKCCVYLWKLPITWSEPCPLEIIFATWQGERSNIGWAYNYNFISWRKMKEKYKLLGLEQTNNDISVNGYVADKVAQFMKKFNFEYEPWNRKGERFYRKKEDKMQELWIFHKKSEGELWVKGVDTQGRDLTLRNIREGLTHYDSIAYVRDLEEINIEKKMKWIMEQIEEEFIPALESEEGYQLEYELTPEMERSQLYDWKELLDELKQKYDIEGIGKDQLPEFVKRVLKANEGRSIEEFGRTLLGLGVLLGEEAIRGKAERHWVWDEKHAWCYVTKGDGVLGIDPAFALNYAWQKKKPQNVDKLCEDLFGDWKWSEEKR